MSGKAIIHDKWGHKPEEEELILNVLIPFGRAHFFLYALTVDKHSMDFREKVDCK